MRILVFQHLEVEHPGVLLDFWKEADHEWSVVEMDRGETIPPLEPYDLLVVMGGPMDVWNESELPWLAAEKAVIRHWVKELRKPYLGVCLGHQLLAEALGGEVLPMKSGPEVGLSAVHLTESGAKDPIFKGVSNDPEVFQWHGAEVSRLPDGAVILAGSPSCVVQAFRWGRHAYGFQYHVEITGSTVSDWKSIPAYKESLERALGAARAAGLAAEVLPRLGSFRAAAKILNSNLMGLVQAHSQSPA